MKYILGGDYGVVLLNDKFILITPTSENSTQYADYVIANTNPDAENSEEINITNKQDLVNLLKQVGIPNLLVSIFILTIMTVYLINIFIVLSDVCVVAVFGWFAARLCGVNFKMNPMIALSIYGLTLSVILDLIFDVIYIMTGFTVEYFNVIYLLIAYVYIIAAIFMIKYDLIKHTEELKKIIEVQKQVERDLAQEKLEKNEEQEKTEELEDKKEDKKPEDKTEEKPEENREPDGSEI